MTASMPSLQVPARSVPLRYERLPWAHPTMLAPLEGVSHPTFRAMIAEQGGVGIVCTEFVRIGTNAISVDAIASQVVKAPGVPLSVQVMGTHAENMAEAAAVVASAGADVVDINLGCPSPRVVRKGAGSAMLKNPELLFDVLSAMREEVPGMLSAKIRAGFDEAESVLRVAKTVEAAGVDYIVVHPRRRCDFYEGIADWRIVRTLAEELDIPVVGNGDCWYAADVERMRLETGCDAVMMGRPALRNPWIFQQAADLKAGRTPFEPTGKDLFEWLLKVRTRYEDELQTLKRGPIGKMKELLTYLGRAVRDEGNFRKTVLRKQTIDEIIRYAEQTLVPLGAEALDLAATPVDPIEQSGSARIDNPFEIEARFEHSLRAPA